MNLKYLIKIFTALQFIALSQNSHVQEAKHRIRTEVRSAWDDTHHHHHHHHQSPPASKHYHHHHNQQHQHHSHQRVYRMRNQWSGGRRRSIAQHLFSGWTAWSACSSGDCIKRRERYCKVKRKCGFTKHVEERKCWGCHPAPVWHTSKHDEHDEHQRHHQQQQQQQQQQTIHHNEGHIPHAIIINAAAASSGLQPVPTSAPPHEVHYHKIQIPILKQTISHHKHHSKHPKYSYAETTGLHSIEDVEEDGAPISAEDDFYVLNNRPKFKRQRDYDVVVNVNDYADLEEENEDEEVSEYVWQNSKKSSATKLGPVHSVRSLNRNNKQNKPHRFYGQQLRSNLKKRSFAPGLDDGIEGDTFQYEDFDFDRDMDRDSGGIEQENVDNQYEDSYEDKDYGEYGNVTWLAPSKEKATPDGLIPRHRRIYSKWSRWTKCSPKCTTRRYKKCRLREKCGREVLREIAYCYTEGSFCQQWLQAQVQKSPPYELRPIAASRRRDISSSDIQSNSIVSDYIMNSKGYRGSEYTPMKLKCGIPAMRNSKKRNLYSMMKIIGGKAARKGEWPWQVAIFNRFKEAFCGGTLIAPYWVLTAAHCVRKVLYVRIGEHNLDYEDGTELQLRVLKTFKHPNFDKKTVDSDVALLRLPKPVNATSWIGFSCLPRPYQPLPKNVDCTVIGWGKRRNRDVAGTSVLHQADVPIISMDNCRSVYQDYTITKNMFCAGHKRGRIDTCAGDSGGPLLCRDTTKPNHPWTIFGITSFGDGCAKRNKFGIYAKVPNYVDWVWSVINCNGNCKMH